MSIATCFRVLCLCAAVLALPAIVFPAPPQFAVERVWTQDVGGNTTTHFAPGDRIQILARLNNSYDGAPLSAELAVTTPFYNDTQTLDIPPGRNTWIWNTGAPSKQDDYTVTVRVFTSSYRVWAMSSARFAVQSSLDIPPGWYKRSGDDSSLIYEDSSGLRIMWGHSYVYRYPGGNPRYWYAELIYLNKGRQTLSIPCVGDNDPSIVKAYMRGTVNSSSVQSEETFCSRNQNFIGSIKPGGIHYEWAIFRTVPRKGGEVSLEVSPYGSSPWVDPWRSSFSAPPPAECPRELVVRDACQSGPALMRLP